MTRLGTLAASALLVGLGPIGALAQDQNGAGHPLPGGHHFQRPVTEVMHDIVWLDDFMHVIMVVIVLFVTALIGYVAIKFSRDKNPTPASFTHNTLIEIVWTAIPVLILVVIAIPSIKLLFKQLDVPESDLTIKAIGNQWYWSYEYPDQDVSFDSLMIGQGYTHLTEEVSEELAAAGYADQDFLFATDTRVVVPVNAVVHVLVTANDVIHNWNVASFGSKVDAIPGRINETWFRAEETGVFYGQCMELCGKDHSFMPIVVEVMTQEDFDTWVLEQQAANGNAPSQVAAVTE